VVLSRSKLVQMFRQSRERLEIPVYSMFFLETDLYTISVVLRENAQTHSRTEQWRAGFVAQASARHQASVSLARQVKSRQQLYPCQEKYGQLVRGLHFLTN